MLRSIIPNLSFWILIFGFGQTDGIAPNDIVPDFPPCIRINGDLSQDIDTNGIIDQKFTFNRRTDKPHIPRYHSTDGKYTFKYNEEFDADFQWFLVEKGANLVTSYLKTPAPYVGAVLSKNPFMLADCTWKIYTDNIWQSVTNPINVQSCEKSKQQGQQKKECGKSNQNPQESNQVPQPVINFIENIQELASTQSSHAQVSVSTISPSTISQPDEPASTVQSQLPVIKSPEPPHIWGQWEEWEHCSGSCGFGTRSRFRKCIGGTDKTHDCFDEARESCEIPCEKPPVIDEIISQAGESIGQNNQSALNCEVFHHELVFTFHNGIVKCLNRPSWYYPAPTFPGGVSIDLTEYWIGARLTDGRWVNDQDEEIIEPIYTEGLTPDGLQVSLLGSEICLYWKNGQTISAPCDETKPVVCCEGLTTSIALNQGNVIIEYIVVQNGGKFRFLTN